MPRFFFDVCDGRCDPDREGVIFADGAAARREAIRRAAMLVKADQHHPGTDRSWHITVRDENNSELFWIDASSVMPERCRRVAEASHLFHNARCTENVDAPDVLEAVAFIRVKTGDGADAAERVIRPGHPAMN